MNPNAVLTRREAQIAEMIAWGFAKKEIALLLARSEKTIDNTAQKIYGKAQVNSAPQLSAWHFCTKHKVSFDRHTELRKLLYERDGNRRKKIRRT